MSINISELIWTVICFFVLLVVLKKLLFDPLVSFMAARIQDGISAGRTAQQQLDAAAQARSDAQRRQSAAADALLAEAKSASERKRAQTLQAAHQEAAQAMRDVRARVRSEETAAAAAVDPSEMPSSHSTRLLGFTALAASSSTPVLPSSSWARPVTSASTRTLVFSCFVPPLTVYTAYTSGSVPSR